jgi:hypothetical protein
MQKASEYRQHADDPDDRVKNEIAAKFWQLQRTKLEWMAADQLAREYGITPDVVLRIARHIEGKSRLASK